MVLGKLPLPERLAYLDHSRARATALADVRARVVWTFFLSSIMYLFFLPLSGRWPDIDLNTVTKPKTTNQPNGCI